MKKGRVLVVGYGSIGRRHARNLVNLGFRPCVLTNYPDGLDADFSSNINKFRAEDIKSCIISSPTAKHLEDFKKCVFVLGGLKKALIEKPLDCSYAKAKEIKRLAARHGVKVYVAYNMRFTDGFSRVAEFVKKNTDRMRIVEMAAGRDLKEWRPGTDISRSYSARRGTGGGVDLDLSHELDYAMRIFGKGFKKSFMHRCKISDLDIQSPDLFKMLLRYKRFVVDITLDYIRSPGQRYIRIICEGADNLYHNFLKRDIAASHKKMLSAFMGIDKAGMLRLCSIDEAANVLRVLEV